MYLGFNDGTCARRIGGNSELSSMFVVNTYSENKFQSNKISFVNSEIQN